MENLKRKEAADIFLYKLGLLEELKKYGKPHIIGSYRMDMMAWNDLDIDIENDAMSLDKLYELTAYIINTFHPTWYEAKEEVTAEGKTVWFQGFETMVLGELWNFDLWFMDKEAINKAEKYCDGIAEKTKVHQNLKSAIIEIKKNLIEKNLYSFDNYTSIDVYRAVLEHDVLNIDEFLTRFQKS